MLLNRLPIRDAEQFFTIQNGGPTFYVQCVFSKAEFESKFIQLGCHIVDSWDDTFDKCVIPGRDDLVVNKYAGYFMVRSDAAGFFGSQLSDCDQSFT